MICVVSDSMWCCRTTMVQLACSCLNIRLHVQESPESLVAGIPNLSPSERQHPFFLKVTMDTAPRMLCGGLACVLKGLLFE